MMTMMLGFSGVACAGETKSQKPEARVGKKVFMLGDTNQQNGDGEKKKAEGRCPQVGI